VSDDRSSANPFKLARYSTDGLTMLATLRTKAETVDTTLDTLTASTSEYVPRMGGVDQELLDLVGDWEHLDTFAGAVAQAFVRADLDSGGSEAAGFDRVMTFDGTVLAEHGQIGYADRDEAIAAAQAMAQRLDELREKLRDDPGSVSPSDIDEFVAMAARGQHDPAFAVTLSEEIGVAGYADAVAIIRGAHQRGGIYEPVPGDGIRAVQVLATVLTTALHAPVEDDDEDAGDAGGDPDKAAARALDSGFVDDLASGFDPLDGQVNTDQPFRIQSDLSVLLRFTDPPTDIAVEIANGRLTPLLQNPESLDVRDDGERWGAYGGMITNYATMLGRDADASALWLNDPAGDGRYNIDLVLQRNPDYPDHGTSYDIDDGEALARVVENGLTNPDDDLTAADPDVSDSHIRLPIREVLMERAVEAIGHQDEIRNPFLYDVLATGVEHNPNVIDTMINENWAGGAIGSEQVTSEVYLTHDFLREVMRDEDAANRVRAALYEQAQQQMMTLPADDASATMQYEMTGRTLGVLTMADANVDVGAVEERLAQQAQAGGAVNYALGWVPYLGQASDIADDVMGNGAGSLIFGSGDPVEEGMDALRPHIDRMDVNMAGLTAVSLYEAGDMSADEIIAASGTDFLAGHPGDADRSIKPLHEMTDDELRAFSDWAVDLTAGGQGGREDFNSLSIGAYRTAVRLQMRT
jgi:hypothetical protein